jgi:acyl carrier protein
LRTGDLGFFNQNQLFITGSLKEQITISGLNLIPNDIENVVDKCHPALQVNGCAVFSIEHDHSDQLVVVQEINRVYINSFNQNEMIWDIQRAVDEHFDVSVYAIVVSYPMSLPKTSSGKIHRNECKKLYLEDKLRMLFSWQSEDPVLDGEMANADGLTADHIMKWLKTWLGEKLGIDPIQIESKQPILSLGLDSIGAVELESELNERFMTDIFVGDFFENITIECIAKTAFKNSLQEKVF